MVFPQVFSADKFPFSYKMSRRTLCAAALLYDDLDSASYGEGNNSRLDDPNSVCVLSVSRCGYGYLTGYGRKYACSFIVGVIGRLCPYSTVVGYYDVFKHRVKGIGHSCVIRSGNGDIAHILDDECVGQFSVLGNGVGREGLCDSKSCFVLGCDGLADSDGTGKTCGGDNGCICDLRA